MEELVSLEISREEVAREMSKSSTADTGSHLSGSESTEKNDKTDSKSMFRSIGNPLKAARNMHMRIFRTDKKALRKWRVESLYAGNEETHEDSDVEVSSVFDTKRATSIVAIARSDEFISVIDYDREMFQKKARPKIAKGKSLNALGDLRRSSSVRSSSVNTPAGPNPYENSNFAYLFDEKEDEKKVQKMTHTQRFKQTSTVIGTTTRQTPLEQLKSVFERMLEEAKIAEDWGALYLGYGPAEGKDLDDVLSSFLRWSCKSEPTNSTNSGPMVSRAADRLFKFHAFVNKHQKGFLDEPVVPSLEKTFCKISDSVNFMIPEWGVELGGIDDCVLWVIDFSRMHREGLDGVENRDLFRWFWWLMMHSIFDERVQDAGVVIVQKFSIGLVNANRWRKKVSDISKDVNELFWGVMPFKLKKTLIVGSPVWVKMIILAKGIEDRTMITSEKGVCGNLDSNLKGCSRGGCNSLPDGFVGGSRKFAPRYKINDGRISGNEEMSAVFSQPKLRATFLNVYERRKSHTLSFGTFESVEPKPSLSLNMKKVQQNMTKKKRREQRARSNTWGEVAQNINEINEVMGVLNSESGAYA